MLIACVDQQLCLTEILRLKATDSFPYYFPAQTRWLQEFGLFLLLNHRRVSGYVSSRSLSSLDSVQKQHMTRYLQSTKGKNYNFNYRE